MFKFSRGCPSCSIPGFSWSTDGATVGFCVGNWQQLLPGCLGKGRLLSPGENFGITGGFSPPQVRKHINDLYEDLRDGHNLISLLEVLSGVKLVSAQGWAGVLESP